MISLFTYLIAHTVITICQPKVVTEQLFAIPLYLVYIHFAKNMIRFFALNNTDRHNYSVRMRILYDNICAVPIFKVFLSIEAKRRLNLNH